MNTILENILENIDKEVEESLTDIEKHIYEFKDDVNMGLYNDADKKEMISYFNFIFNFCIKHAKKEEYQTRLFKLKEIADGL